MFDQLFKRRATGLQTAPSESGSSLHASLDELISLRLQARQIRFGRYAASANLLAGNHASRFKGRGMDYLESRFYQPGDDIRNMDWRITARTQQPHVKLFQEERERPVIIMTDLNRSMFFASRGQFKSALACRTAALLAWSAVNNGDRIGGLIANSQHIELQPKGGKRGVLAYLQQLATHSQPKHALFEQSDIQPHINESFNRLLRLARPGSLVFILSDFYRLDEHSRQQLSRLKHNAELVLLRLQDPLENTAPPPNRYVVSDGRNQAVLNTRDQTVLHDYGQWFQQRQSLIQDISRQLAIPLLTLSTTDDALSRLQQLFSHFETRQKHWRRHR
ncbi:MAG: DUF58 domain-containing protein [Chromatiales bacterium]|jgi:uncharacterized protein (DUF58 family)